VRQQRKEGRVLAAQRRRAETVPARRARRGQAAPREGVDRGERRRRMESRTGLTEPGRGTTPCARTQAIESCAGVTPFFSAIDVSLRTSCMLCSKCSSENLSKLRRMSPSGRSSLLFQLLPKKPAPSGLRTNENERQLLVYARETVSWTYLYAMMGMSSSLQAARTPLSSISSANGEYSTSTAATGPTAAALRIVSADTLREAERQRSDPLRRGKGGKRRTHSDRPMSRKWPSSRKMRRFFMVCVRG